MGLHVWPKAEIRKQDAVVAKNYLSPTELRELNRLTVILLDIFEDQPDLGRLTTMATATQLLDSQLRQLNRVVLSSGGRVSHDAAEARAKSEYMKFDEKRKAERVARANAELAALKAAGKGLPRGRRSKKDS